MPWTRDQMTDDEVWQWLASREEAGRIIDVGVKPGVVDRILLHNGRFHALEIKRDRKARIVAHSRRFGIAARALDCMTDTLADQHYRQLPVSTTTIRAIMRSAAFVAGVDDVRSGRAPDYDASCFSQDEDEVVARTKINGHWNYERGRQWARLAPPSMPLKIDGVVNPKAVALFDAAVKLGYIARRSSTQPRRGAGRACASRSR